MAEIGAEQVIYLIRWDEETQNKELCGGYLQYAQDGSVIFENATLSPSTTVKKWRSITDYARQKKEPRLPILEIGKKYVSRMYLKTEPEDTALLQFSFYDRQNMLLKTEITRAGNQEFVVPEHTYTYAMELVNSGFRRLWFHHIEIEEEQTQEIRNTGIFNRTDDTRLHIFLPEPGKRMMRFQDLSQMYHLPNMIWAPIGLVLPKPFQDLSWLEQFDRIQYPEFHFIYTGSHSREIAEGIVFRFRNSYMNSAEQAELNHYE